MGDTGGGRANIDRANSRVRKSNGSNGNGDSRGNKIPSQQTEVDFLKSNEPTMVLRACQVILTRCDGLASPDRSFKTFNENKRASGESVAGTCLKKSDKSDSGLALIVSKICKTRPREVSGKQTLYCRASTQVGMKQHKCQLCSKSFSDRSHLHIHMRSHTCERPYKCKLCLKSFKHKHHLKGHIQRHDVERPHQCQICSKSFGELVNLKTHIRTHTGERPHQCNLCSKSFGQQSTLNRHIRCHTGERPYQCQQVCSKSFGQSGALKSHIKTHKTDRDTSIVDVYKIHLFNFECLNFG